MSHGPGQCPVRRAPRQVRLCAVLDQHDAVFVGQRTQLSHGRWLPEQVHRDDRPGPARDLLPDGVNVQVAAVRLDVGEDRDGVLHHDRQHRPGVREAGGDDLIAGFGIDRRDRQVQRGSTGA